MLPDAPSVSALVASRNPFNLSSAEIALDVRGRVGDQVYINLDFHAKLPGDKKTTPFKFPFFKGTVLKAPVSSTGPNLSNVPFANGAFDFDKSDAVPEEEVDLALSYADNPNHPNDPHNPNNPNNPNTHTHTHTLTHTHTHTHTYTHSHTHLHTHTHTHTSTHPHIHTSTLHTHNHIHTHTHTHLHALAVVCQNR
jgi:hypothetical protein